MSLLGVAVATALEHSYGEGWESAAKNVLGVALLVCGLAFLVKALVQPRLTGAGIALLAGTVAVVRALRRGAAARAPVDPVEEAAGS